MSIVESRDALDHVCSICEKPAVVVQTYEVVGHRWILYSCQGHRRAHELHRDGCLRCSLPTSGLFCRICLEEISGSRHYLKDTTALLDAAARMVAYSRTRYP